MIAFKAASAAVCTGATALGTGIGGIASTTQGRWPVSPLGESPTRCDSAANAHGAGLELGVNLALHPRKLVVEG